MLYLTFLIYILFYILPHILFHVLFYVYSVFYSMFYSMFYSIFILYFVPYTIRFYSTYVLLHIRFFLTFLFRTLCSILCSIPCSILYFVVNPILYSVLNSVFYYCGALAAYWHTGPAKPIWGIRKILVPPGSPAHCSRPTTLTNIGDCRDLVYLSFWGLPAAQGSKNFGKRLEGGSESRVFGSWPPGGISTWS